MATANKFDAFCYKCGRKTAKGKGFIEKTTNSHRVDGITAQWLTRCHRCVGKQFSAGNVSHLSEQLGKLLPKEFSRLGFSGFFDNKGIFHARYTLFNELGDEPSFQRGMLSIPLLPSEKEHVKALMDWMIAHSEPNRVLS